MNYLRIRRILLTLGALAVAAFSGGLDTLVGQETAGEPFTITGIVQDASDNTPLQYAVVGIPELEAWALSDASGSYSLEVPGTGIFRFLVVKRGYYFADQAVTFAGPDELDVLLEKEEDDTQVGPGRLVGRVMNVDNGRPIRDAIVRLSPTGQEAETDRQGRFLINDVSAGALLLQVEKDDFESMTDTLAAFPGVTLALDIGMTEEGNEEAGVTAEAWPRYLESVGFYRRAESGRGDRFGALYLGERGGSRLSDILERLPGVEATRIRGRTALTVRSQFEGDRRCVLGTYVDNMEMHGFDIDTYPVDWIQALEVYEGSEIPPQYNHSCGVVLIWSRR